MKSFVKHMLAVGITSALSFSLANNAEAATYQVVDKTIGTELKHTYAQEQNSNGVLAISGSNLYNFPVQFNYLNDTDYQAIQRLAAANHEKEFGLNDLEDFDALSKGNPSANDLAWTKMYLAQNQATFEYQPVGDVVAMINLGGNSTTELFNVFDQPFDSGNASGKLTRSTLDIISGVTNSGIAYGSATAPYVPMAPFTTSNSEEKTFWLREFGQRGFFSYDNGAQVFPVVPEETRYGGGVSAVSDVNDNDEAVGYMSYALNDVAQKRVESKENSDGCLNPKVVGGPDLEEANKIHLGIYPFEICVQRLQSSMYELIAYKASFSPNGEVTSENLGLLVEPHEDDERKYSSRALAINIDGVAVGFADGWDETGEITPSKDQRQSAAYAVMFKEGKVFDFNQEHFGVNANSFEYSKAHDISDNGLAVGYTYNTDFIKKFFYVDTSLAEEEMALVTPDGFFNSSASTAYAVNNNGMIVGDAEVEIHNSSNGNNPRRTSAFLYDTENDTFSDVNDLLTCNSPYTVVEARSINDSNVITGTAIFKADRYDAKGVIMLDAKGNPLREDVARAVILEPIEGEIDDCFEEEDKIEREGASSGVVALFSLFAFFSLRLFRKIN